MNNELNAYLAAGQVSLSNALFSGFAASDLTQHELIVYLFLTQWASQHDEAPALDTFAQSMKLAKNETYNVIASLIKKGAVQLVSRQDEAGRAVDQYDVTPLLAKLLTAPTVQPANIQALNAGQQIFNEIEVEFGRPLSPIEQQTIGDWLNVDHYEPAVISLALREAVLNQAYSLRYMDRILINWERRHLTTAAQVQADLKRQKNGL
ncbi:DnaD domain-containing protein [Lacticaseibacillus yichunensis]|uniref:DnaD domain-containing protein n=1 Tax=Lacticaseibacillus yichunensis TaxID=2486015 RepID=A0ABW4CSH8_9LACO|nr:DnaD domain protein [Lacticaseibacillus yichunensis]